MFRDYHITNQPNERHNATSHIDNFAIAYLRNECMHELDSRVNPRAVSRPQIMRIV